MGSYVAGAGQDEGMKFEPTPAPGYGNPDCTGHKRHVHITGDPALLEDEAWAGLRKPDKVILCPDGFVAGGRAIVLHPDEEWPDLSD